MERESKKEREGPEDADWYANELFAELNEYGEQRFPKLGEMCASFHMMQHTQNTTPWYDTRPLVYVLEYQEDRIIGCKRLIDLEIQIINVMQLQDLLDQIRYRTATTKEDYT